VRSHQFEVESVLPQRGGPTDGHILVKSLAGGDFSVPEGSTLDGRAVVSWLDTTRALSDNGSQRTDLFVLRLRDVSDAEGFEVGQRVTLEWEE
jgi:hypothetical protein